MNRDVDHVITPDRFTTDRVVEREGKINHGSARRGAAVGWGIDNGPRREAANRGIALHGVGVVEDERRGEAAAVDAGDREDEPERRETREPGDPK